MDRTTFRCMLAALFAAAICVAGLPDAGATGRAAPLEHLLATAVDSSDPPATSRIDIFIERWSDEAQATTLGDTLIHDGPSHLLPTLITIRRPAGVVLMPGIQGRGARARTRTPRRLLFAREVGTAYGRQVILVSDQHLGLGEAPRQARVSTSEFNLVDIRFGPDGKGVGKIALAEDLMYNATTRIVEAKNYETRDVRLIDVRSERR
jgi:hypothetical protein